MTEKESLKALIGDFSDAKMADGESHAYMDMAAFKMAYDAFEKQKIYRGKKNDSKRSFKNTKR